ncbi:MAG: MgtC/SapB family protein [Candidatus Eisenbacteria bacterium]|uniref:MgtC/SapB family protein n=1 Tax=Eiseniibacteriota bacterium TaxID=2212470 RepID=A0A849SM62_UNCEI|nr:MgtC/SapB family protein [Candidatus Eisenbacteria bacterium]
MMEELTPMLVSLGLGTLVGLEREAGRKPAGLRTHVLVCVGSTVYVLISAHAAAIAPGNTYDPTRVVHGVITGVGFLGAGAIIRREGMTHGLTTAASIWTAAAIGVAVGVRAYALASITTAIALLVLEVYRWLEKKVPRDDPNESRGGGD